MIVPFSTLPIVFLMVTSAQADMIKVRKGDESHQNRGHVHSDQGHRLQGINATHFASSKPSGPAVNGTSAGVFPTNGTQSAGNVTFGGSMNVTLGSSINTTLLGSSYESNSSKTVYSTPVPSSTYSSTAAEEEELPDCDEENDESLVSSAFSSAATFMPSSASVTATTRSSVVSIITSSAQVGSSSALASATTTPAVVVAAVSTRTQSSSAASQTSSTSASATGATESDIAAYLKAHNDFRSKYNASALTWDTELAAYAQAWGDKCSFKHSGGQYGENLAAGTGSYSIASAVKGWTDEANTYDFSSGDYDHFTQVVWKSTTALGCSASKCTDLDAFGANSGVATFYVCSYNPPGNYLGEFKENVEGVTCADC